MAGPAFATGDYEFQCLHGMGEPLYEEVVGTAAQSRPCRIYAPVGSHEALLAYLVRRLLENGANSSLVNRIADPAVPIDELLVDPVEAVRAMAEPGRPHDGIAHPTALYGDRRNSAGIDLTDEDALAALDVALRQSVERHWTATPADGVGTSRDVLNPADHRNAVGRVVEATPDMARAMAARATRSEWPATPVPERADCLDRAADALQAEMPVLLGLIVREAGKSLPNAIGEVREAIDFLRYYARQARDTLGAESRPIGPAVCISPWNFPLAIFMGQVAAALVAGNPVLAKPAEETPLIAAVGVRILHAAGVPAHALQLVPGEGAVGAALVAAPEIAGVLFTGSTEVARSIQAELAKRLSPDRHPIPFIAETGGQNAMIVDSSALAEQVVADVIASAFDSAGQRCSALRILCLQEEIADRTLTMLTDALKELRIGPTDRLAVDVGPVISAEAQAGIESHVATMQGCGHRITRLALPDEAAYGTFVAPTIIEIDDITALRREVFGPVLHVVRYRRDRLNALIDAINATGYGLTFGLHTRLDEVVDEVSARVRAGNRYINRNMIGAVVGVQPFGGNGLSGTGPKAGGPRYLRRLVRAGVATAEPAAEADPALLAFAGWLEVRGEVDAAARARRYGRQTALGCEMELPGPVGERNLYALHPRGRILLRPTTRHGLFDQLAAVLATGNLAVVEAALLPADLPAGVAARIDVFTSTGALAGALVEGDAEQVGAALRDIAGRPGPIVLTQAAAPGQCARGPTYDLDWLLQEVSTSINTTAAGGNASLMMLE